MSNNREIVNLRLWMSHPWLGSVSTSELSFSSSGSKVAVTGRSEHCESSPEAPMKQRARIELPLLSCAQYANIQKRVIN